jgi:hypothetical protein
MGRVIAITLLLGLSACSHGVPGAHEHAAVAQDPLACPNVPSSIGYAVSKANGIDFLDCTMKPLRAGLPSAMLYVGNFPYAQDNLQFFGFTSSRVGSLAWFSSTSGTGRHWVTYIPTGCKFPAVLMLSVDARDAPSLEQLGTVAGIVLSHSSNNSFQRTRCARR